MKRTLNETRTIEICAVNLRKEFTSYFFDDFCVLLTIILNFVLVMHADVRELFRSQGFDFFVFEFLS